MKRGEAKRLRKEYLAACRHDGIKTELDQRASFLLNETQLFQHLPHAREGLDLVNTVIRWCQFEYPAMLKVGKFSPEAKRYLVGRLNILIKVATHLRDTLEAEVN